MRDTLLRVKSNRVLTRDIFELVFEYDGEDFEKPGQFINVSVDGLFLRRPFSVCEEGGGELRIIIKQVGMGTKKLREMKAGEEVRVLLGLGNGFDILMRNETQILIGGGVGVPPLYGLAKKMVREGIEPKVILGFNSGEDVFYAGEFRALGLDTEIYTVNGDTGRKGMVTDGIKEECYVYACGPTPMLKALCEHSMVKGGQLSLEERMGCGFGACMGCSIKTKTGWKRVCKDGPVFDMEELLWRI